MLHTFPLTVYGVPITGIAFTAGESVTFALTCQDAQTRLALDLTGGSVRLSIAAVDVIRQVPAAPALIAKQAVISAPATNGIATVTLAPGDTSAMAAGGYFLDVWVTAADGSRFALLPLSRMILTAATA